MFKGVKINKDTNSKIIIDQFNIIDNTFDEDEDHLFVQIMLKKILYN